MKKILKEIWEVSWFAIPMSLLVLLFAITLYYNSHYCKTIPYVDTCEECLEWVNKDNGRWGKFRRTWQECKEYRYYKCISTYDSCGCTKLK